jgi:nicotinamidase-related amidase
MTPDVPTDPATPDVVVDLDPARTAVVVIDPQVGFCSPSGTLARVFGADDLVPVRAALNRLASFLRDTPRTAAVLLVTSLYPLGLHTEGDLSDPLASLCVPDVGADCEVVEEIVPRESWLRVTKCQINVWETLAFRSAVNNLAAQGRRTFLITGFMATTCVCETVVSMLTALGRRKVTVLVVEDMVGARARSYRPDAGGTSRIHRAYLAMISAGAAMISSSASCRWLSGSGRAVIVPSDGPVDAKRS